MLLGTVLDELERRDLSTGLVTLCIGGVWALHNHRTGVHILASSRSCVGER
jgi:acetyl-CoA acetyltransferase